MKKIAPLFLIFILASFNTKLQAAIPIQQVSQQSVDHYPISKKERAQKKPGVIAKKIKWFLSTIRQAEEKPQKTRPTDGFAILGFLIALAGLFYAGLILGSLGLIVSLVSLLNINDSERLTGKGIAIAGIILGAIAILGALYFLLF